MKRQLGQGGQPTRAAAENSVVSQTPKTKPSAPDMPALSERLCQWADQQDWRTVDAIAYPLRFERQFGKEIRALIVSQETVGQRFWAQQIVDAVQTLLALCQRLDRKVRDGCYTESEVSELEYLRDQVISAIHRLAELIMPRPAQSSCEPSARSGHCSAKTSCAADAWITFSKAAELLGVTKATISKWANQNRFVDNGLANQRRRLSRGSVLLVKQQMEEEDLLKDVEELRQDARRLGT